MFFEAGSKALQRPRVRVIRGVVHNEAPGDGVAAPPVAVHVEAGVTGGAEDIALGLLVHAGHQGPGSGAEHDVEEVVARVGEGEFEVPVVEIETHRGERVLGTAAHPVTWLGVKEGVAGWWTVALPAGGAGIVVAGQGPGPRGGWHRWCRSGVRTSPARPPPDRRAIPGVRPRRRNTGWRRCC